MAEKESLTGIEHDVQIEERTKHAMENYSQWLQNAMSASPWSNLDLNKKLLSYATTRPVVDAQSTPATSAGQDTGVLRQDPLAGAEQAPRPPLPVEHPSSRLLQILKSREVLTKCREGGKRSPAKNCRIS
jgi:hypothetical protein